MESDADVITIDGSRGWGKSMFCVGSIVLPHMLRNNNTQVMWVAPTYKICRSPIDDVWYGVDEETGERYIPDTCPHTGYKFWEYLKGDGEIHLFNNSKMYIRSAENPDSIVSKGYSLIIIDEAALISKEVFYQQILPTARRKNCKIILISTPRGKNWFHTLFLDGQDFSKKSYYSSKQPWWKRPDYPPLLIELMKDLPEHIRKQEFEAEFIDGGSGTFTNLDSIFYGPKIDYKSDQQEWEHKDAADFMKNQECVLAVDFAKSVDYTVLVVFTMVSRDMIYYRRINKTDYKIILDMIKITAKKFNDADLIYDATGVGSGLSDFLSNDLNVYPYVFTNTSKNELIHRLIVAAEYENIKIPYITTIRSEFETFEFQLTRTGKISYNAADGRHDDAVIAISLANWYIEENGGEFNVASIDNFLDLVNERSRPKSIFDEMDEDND